MSAEKLAENIAEIAKNAVPKIPHKWSNVQNISIKTPESVALPIYNKTPEVLRELGKLAGFVEEIDTPETEAEPKDENETVNDKKRDLKSPLLRALKKQKQEENKKAQKKKAKEEEKKQKKDEDKPVEKKETPKQKKRRASSEGSTKEDSEQASPAKKKKGETPESTKKAVKKEKEANTPTKQDTEQASSAKKKKEAKTPESTKKAVKKEAKTPESTKKAVKKEAKTPESTKKATKKPEAETKKKDADDDGKNKEFIATKKFNGSKKGYVFKMGKQGVGYYVDAKPVVDRMAMEAIQRLGKNNRKGGQKKNKKGGRRSF
jgi:hypothetical protein